MMSNADVVVNGRFMVHRVTGIPRYGYELVRRLGRRVRVIAPPSGLKGQAGHLWEQMILPNYVRDRLLWSPHGSGPLVISRQVVTIHDMATFEHPEWFAPIYVAWYNYLIPRLTRRARHIITISNFSKQRLIDILGIPPEKVTVIYNGVSSYFAPQPSSAIFKVRQKLGIPTPHYVLYLGTLEPRKNLNGVLEAWTLLTKTLPSDIWLVIAGSIERSPVFRDFRLLNMPARVHRLGYVRDEFLPALYSGALVFIYVSYYEGFGLPPLEAMACGTPVVVSNGSSLPEVVGDAGIQVNPFNTDEIASAVQSVIENTSLRKHLQAKGLARAKLFTWDRTAEQTWQLLRAIADSC